MTEKKRPAISDPPSTDVGKAEGPPKAAPRRATRYKVRSSGISTPSGARYRDAVLTADEIGDADRVQQLLDKGAIEEAHD